MIAEAAILAYSATGSIRRTARETGLARETVEALLERNPEATSTARKRLANSALSLSDKCVKVADRKHKSLSAYQAVLSSKILGQMALEQLDQMPSTVTINLALLTTGVGNLEAVRAAIEARSREAIPLQVVSDATPQPQAVVPETASLQPKNIEGKT